MITLSNVSYTSLNKSIISDFSYSFKPGKSYCLIGASGSGKTTLLKLISNIIMPTNGSIAYSPLFFNSEPIRAIPLNLNPTLTVVFQDFKLFPHLTVYENLLLPLRVNGIEYDETYIESLLKYFRVNELKKSKVFNISIGQRQRLAYIRAIILNPKILLLDEITSSLDIESVQLITTHINRFLTSDTSIILASHSISFCKRVSTDYLFIDEGILESFGSIDDLPKSNSSRLQSFLSSY